MEQLKDATKKYGPWAGALFAIIMAAIPYLNGTYQTHREQNRADKELTESICNSILSEVRKDNKELRSDVVALNYRVADLESRLRISRRADYGSKFAKYEFIDVNGKLVLDWFNPTFEQEFLIAQGIDPNAATGKTWRELFHPDLVAEAERTDDVVRMTLQPVSSDAIVTYEKRADGMYKVTYQDQKEAILSESNQFRGTRGSAVAYKKNKQSGLAHSKTPKSLTNGN